VPNFFIFLPRTLLGRLTAPFRGHGCPPEKFLIRVLTISIDMLDAACIPSVCVCVRMFSAESSKSSHCNGCGSAELSSPVSQTSPMALSSPSASPAGSGVLSPTHECKRPSVVSDGSTEPNPARSCTVTFCKSAAVVSKIHSRRFRE